jgi:ABC-type lipoprotein release transport system permease subunit
MRALGRLRLLLAVAVRNQLANGRKTLMVGGAIFMGALLVVVGMSLMAAVRGALSHSIVSSVAGHLQVYSAASRDQPTVIAGTEFDGGDMAPIEDFARLQQALRRVPNVSSVVPMGISGALVVSGTVLDVVLAGLRQRVQGIQAGDRRPQTLAAYQSEKAHVRQIARVLESQLGNQVEGPDSADAQDLQAVRRAAGADFWRDFDAHALDRLELLENHLAPAAGDGENLYLRYVGTDLQAFGRTFDRLRIVDGTTIPAGQRGFLLSKQTYETMLKLKTATRLDAIKEALDKGGRISDRSVRRLIDENVAQLNDILLQLDGRKTELFREKLQRFLPSQESDVARLLARFLAVSGGDFPQRYRFFYQELAPSLDLYRVRIGDTLTIRGFSRTGYVQSMNVKVYGTFEFRGLEGSGQAGFLNLMDLVTFRELYGFTTEDSQRELNQLRSTAGSHPVSREHAEAELFGPAGLRGERGGAGRPAAARVADARALDQAVAGLSGTARRRGAASGGYDPAELQGGAVLSAAVMVHDPTRLKDTIRAITAAGRQVGIPLQAITWEKSAGLLGQFVTMIQVILMGAMGLIFLNGLIVLNNALLLATLQRIPEIGTLRALGAGRRFVMAMVLVEALAVGALFGGAGAALGCAVVLRLGRGGLPAVNDLLRFLFSGPRLYPALDGGSVTVALLTAMVVSLLCSAGPALVALGVTPRQAMQQEE